MIHLKMLAERFDDLAAMAADLAIKYGNEKSVFLRGHYGGEVIAFSLAAYMLRQASLEHESMLKEEAE